MDGNIDAVVNAYLEFLKYKINNPRDVRCAKVHDAHCIAVATGPYTKEQLLNTHADIVLDSLAEVERCISFIMGL